MAIRDPCRRHGFTEAWYSLWRSKFGGMNVPDAKRLKELEAEDARLTAYAQQLANTDIINPGP